MVRPSSILQSVSSDAARRALAESYADLRRQALALEPSTTRARAILQVGQSDVPSRVDDLASILRDSRTPDRLRHLAATLLGKIDRDAAREILGEALDRVDARLTGRCALSLARIGDASAIPRLRQAVGAVDGVPRTQIQFALRMIAHRHESTGPDGPEPYAPESKAAYIEPCAQELQPVMVRPADLVTAQTALGDLEREPFGVEWSESSAQVVRCIGSLSVLFLSEALRREGGLVSLRHRRAIAGIVARSTEASATFSPHLLILSAPASHAGAVDLDAYHPTGVLAFGGRAYLDGDRLSFELRGIQRQGGYAAHVTGFVDPDGLRVERALVGQLLRDVAHATHSRRGPAVVSHLTD